MKISHAFLMGLVLGLIFGLLFAASLSHHLLNRSEAEAQRLESLLLSKEVALVRVKRSLKDLLSNNKSWALKSRSMYIRCNTVRDLEINSMQSQLKKLREDTDKHKIFFKKLGGIWDERKMTLRVRDLED